MQPVYIAAAKRSPIGKYRGMFAEKHPADIAAPIIRQVAHGLPIDQVLMGNAIQAGLGQNPARQAAIKAGLQESVPATTINSVCSSGMQSVIFGAQAIGNSDAHFVIAGGMECMSFAPLETVQYDGLTCALTGEQMGDTAERLAGEFNIERVTQDAYALESHHKAIAARKIFENEIVAINGNALDETPRPDTSIEKLQSLQPVFSPIGTVTAGNASTLADGAAVLLLASNEALKKHRMEPMAKIIGYATIGTDPKRMGMGAAIAAERVLEKTNLGKADIDLWEINEAFAAQTIAVLRSLNINPQNVNIFGGALALGHPLGASGARIIVTLINALKATDKRRGLATVCVGGGQGSAMIIERL